MKYQKILGLVATAGLLLAGCATDSDNNNTWLSDPNAVHVSASVGSIFTRSKRVCHKSMAHPFRFFSFFQIRN